MHRTKVATVDGEPIYADYRLDINTEEDIRIGEGVDFDGAAQSPPPDYDEYTPKAGYERLVLVENDEVLDELVAYLQSEGIEYDVTDVRPTVAEARDDVTRKIKEAAQAVLLETDWYVVREQETGEAIPEDVKDHREWVRELSDEFEADVFSIDDVEAIYDYSFEYPDPPE